MGEKIKNLFKSYFFDGLLLVVLGLVMLLFPSVTDTLLCIIIGAVIGVIGLIKCITFFTSKNAIQAPTDLLVGLVELAVGVAMIIKSQFFINLFAVVAGVILSFGAILMLTQAYIIRKEGGAMPIIALIFGVITAIFAILIFINPFKAVEVTTRIRGISLIAEGLGIMIVLHSAKLTLE